MDGVTTALLQEDRVPIIWGAEVSRGLGCIRHALARSGPCGGPISTIWGLSDKVQRCTQHPDNILALHGPVECLERRGNSEELAVYNRNWRRRWPSQTWLSARAASAAQLGHKTRIIVVRQERNVLHCTPVAMLPLCKLLLTIDMELITINAPSTGAGHYKHGSDSL